MGPGIYALDLPGKDPGGHFGLATHDYTHATAPNRRYADLVTQRLVKAALADAPAPYSNDELTAIADAMHRARRRREQGGANGAKDVAALLLSDRIGETFDGDRHRRGTEGHVRAHDPSARRRNGGAQSRRASTSATRCGSSWSPRIRQGYIDFEGQGER